MRLQTPPKSLPRLPVTVVVEPVLQFNPNAWAKLLHIRDLGQTEVGGFGVVPLDNLLCVEEFHVIKQRCSFCTIAFDDDAVADFFDVQVDAGRQPQQFARIWMHTHPGTSPAPSQLDEDTFARVFGKADWAVMFILARGGEAYARLRFNTGPGGSIDIPVQIAFHEPFLASDHDAWTAEYNEKVTTFVFKRKAAKPRVARRLFKASDYLERDMLSREEEEALWNRDE